MKKEKQVYYDKRTNGLFVTYRICKHRVIIGGLSFFYVDAISNYDRYSIPNRYFRGCKPINRKSKLLKIRSTTGSLILKTAEDANGEIPMGYFWRFDNKKFRYLRNWTNKIVKTHRTS